MLFVLYFYLSKNKFIRRKLVSGWDFFPHLLKNQKPLNCWCFFIFNFSSFFFCCSVALSYSVCLFCYFDLLIGRSASFYYNNNIPSILTKKTMCGGWVFTSCMTEATSVFLQYGFLRRYFFRISRVFVFSFWDLIFFFFWLTLKLMLNCLILLKV